MPTCGTCGKVVAPGITSCPDDGAALIPDDLAPPSPELPPGTAVGDYVVERKIGEGAYGVVYAAEHPVIGKRAALKLLDRKYCTDLSIVSRFITEARAVNRIRHPNIVDVFAFGKHGEQHFLAMELLDGTSLGELLEARGRLPLAEALPILRGIAEALDAAHAVGIVHRDLKPDNVFLVREPDGRLRPKLLDFGVAKLAGEGEVMHKTATGTAVGTPLYMSPEQCRGKPVQGSSDVYALGAVTFQVLTGRPPFDGESVMDVLMAHISEPPPRASGALPALGPALDGPVAAMLAKRPEDRPSPASRAIADLERASGADPRAPTLAVPGVATLRTGPSAASAAERSAAQTIADPTPPTTDPGKRPTLLSADGEPTAAHAPAPEPARARSDGAGATLASPGAAQARSDGAPASLGSKVETMTAITAPPTPRPGGRGLLVGAGGAVLLLVAAATAMALRGSEVAPTPAASSAPEVEARASASATKGGEAPPDVVPSGAPIDPVEAGAPPASSASSAPASAAAAAPTPSPRPPPPRTPATSATTTTPPPAETARPKGPSPPAPGILDVRE